MGHEPHYSPLIDGDGANSETELLSPPHNFAGQRWRTQLSERRWSIFLANVVLGILNVTVLTATVYLYCTNTYRRQELVYSPASQAVEYEARTLNTSIFSRNKYNGPPTDASDAAWEKLLHHENVLLSKQDLEKLGRTSVEIMGHGYLGGLGVFHQLHCLNYIRKRLHPEFYPLEEDPVTTKVHTAHCIDNLRQIIQCHGDTSILTYSWRPDYSSPWPDFQIQHECRNFNKITAWAKSRNPHITDINMLNPYFRNGKHPPDSTPTQFENSTELVGGTRSLGIASEEDY